MRSVALPVSPNGCAPSLSVLGFGCAALMGRVGRKGSLAALAAARDAGITFFDTARSYGYGESETLLGQFLKGQRESVVLCTKFGILPARRTWKHALKPLAQMAVKAFPTLRSYARTQAAAGLQTGQFSLDTLRTSFETSLRELQTGYVDILLLHAATLDVLDRDDLFAALERLIESGKVRMAGISGEHPVIAETFRRQPPVFTTAQFALNPATLDFVHETSRPEARKLLLVANHPFGGAAGIAATAADIEALSLSPDLPTELREKLTGRDPQLLPEVVLNVLLSGTGISAVLPTMMQAANLHNNVRAVEHCRFTPDELRLLREAFLCKPALPPSGAGAPPAAAQAPSA